MGTLSACSSATTTDMRLPVNLRSLTGVLTLGFVQAGGHMGSALDHADIRGFEPHISVGPEPASNQARAYKRRITLSRISPESGARPRA
jgi:hypothetical protein